MLRAASRAVLDGEIVCLAPDGKSHFDNLLFGREWPYFMAFDLLGIGNRLLYVPDGSVHNELCEVVCVARTLRRFAMSRVSEH
jgi:hypothetical protein